MYCILFEKCLCFVCKRVDCCSLLQLVAGPKCLSLTSWKKQTRKQNAVLHYFPKSETPLLLSLTSLPYVALGVRPRRPDGAPIPAQQAVPLLLGAVARTLQARRTDGQRRRAARQHAPGRQVREGAPLCLCAGTGLWWCSASRATHCTLRGERQTVCLLVD